MNLWLNNYSNFSFFGSASWGPYWTYIAHIAISRAQTHTHTYIHTQKHTHIHIYTHTYIYTYTYTCRKPFQLRDRWRNITPMPLGLFDEKLQPKVCLAWYDILFAYFILEVKSKTVLEIKNQNKTTYIFSQNLNYESHRSGTTLLQYFVSPLFHGNSHPTVIKWSKLHIHSKYKLYNTFYEFAGNFSTKSM